jgi:hypothetical protein
MKLSPYYLVVKEHSSAFSKKKSIIKRRILLLDTFHIEIPVGNSGF